MAEETLVRVGVEAELKNQAQLVKQFDEVSDTFEASWNSTVDKAVQATLSPKKLAPFKAEQKRIQALLDKAQSSREKAVAVAEQQRFKKELQHVEDISDRRLKAIKELGGPLKKVTKEAAKEFGGGIKDAFTSAASGSVSGMMGSFKKMGAAMQKLGTLGGATQKGGPFGVLIRGLGGATKALGTFAAGLGIVGGVLAMAGAAMSAVDKQAKEMNRTLTEGGVTANDLGVRGGELSGKLDAMRKHFTDFSLNFKWGTLAKDHFKILAAFNESGLALREMTRGAKTTAEEMRKLQEHTEAALTYSKLLGVSAEEAAKNMAMYMEDLGYTLEGVRDRFSAMNAMAKEAGFNTKRFFNMVLQATSGMTMYNVRIEQAAGLLVQMSKIIGAMPAGEQLQGMGKGFAGESRQDRTKRIMRTGKPLTKRVITLDAQMAGEAWMKEFTKLAPDVQDALGKVFTEAGMTAGKRGKGGAWEGVGGKDFAAQFAKLSTKDRGAFMVELRKKGGKDSADIIRQLYKLGELAQGSTGKMKEMVDALGYLSHGGKFAMEIAGIAAVSSKPLYLMGNEQLMAFEALEGKSGEQLDAFRQLTEGFYSNFDALQAAQKNAANLSAKDRQELLDATGMTVNEQGKIVTALEGGVEIKNLQEYLMRQGDKYKDVLKPQVAEDIMLARDVVRNTTDMSHILKIGVQSVLERLYTAVSGIFQSLIGDESGAHQEAIAMEQKEANKLNQNLLDLEEKRARIEEKLKEKGLDPKEKGALEHQKKALDEQVKNASLQLETSRAIQASLYEVTPKIKGTYGSTRTGAGFLNQATIRAGASVMPILEKVYGSKEKVEAERTKVQVEMRDALKAKIGEKFGVGAEAAKTEESFKTAIKAAMWEGKLTKEGGEKFEWDEIEEATAEMAGVYFMMTQKFDDFLKDEKKMNIALLGRAPSLAAAGMKKGPGIDLLGILNEYMGAATKVSWMEGGETKEKELALGNVLEGFLAKTTSTLFESESKKARETGSGVGSEEYLAQLSTMTKEDMLKKIKSDLELKNLTKDERDWLKKIQKDVSETGPDKIVNTLLDLEEKRELREMTGKLFAAGIGATKEQAEGLAKKLIKGSAISEEEQRMLGEASRTMEDKTVMQALLGMGVGVPTTAPAGDWIGHFDSNGPTFTQRVDSADDVDVVAHKAGGRIRTAGGAGGTRIVNVFGSMTEHMRSNNSIKLAVMGYTQA